MILIPGNATLAQLHTIWSGQGPVTLDPSSHEGIKAAAKAVERAAAGDEAVYGINTGFGKLASV